MRNQDWERFGEDIRRTVQDAVNSGDFRRLNQPQMRSIRLWDAPPDTGSKGSGQCLSHCIGKQKG